MNPLVRGLSLLCALAWAGLIYYLSSQPSIDITPVFEHQDKLLHLAAYAVLGFFGMGAMQVSTSGYRVSQLLMVATLTGLYGLLDEYHQSFVPGRNASVLDVLADCTGAMLGAGLAFLLVRWLAYRSSGVTV
ncbi:MAG: VanZ family protein [Gammaproteobacteria bacterium]